MALSIDVKRFHELEKRSFVAIAPIWSGYAAYHKQKPVNQIKFKGITVPRIELDRSIGRNWHPDNVFSEEKWIEVHLYHCKWELNTNKEYNLISRSPIGRYGENHIMDWLFFVPAQELRSLYECCPDGGIIYKSNDRAEFEGRKYVQAWTEMHSNAIANSYY